MKLHQNWITDLGKSQDEVLVDKAISRFDLQRYESLEGFEVTIDGVTEQVVIQNYTNPLNQSKDAKKIHCELDSKVKTGSIVRFANADWIVTSKIKDNPAYKSAEMVESNNSLKFFIKDANQNSILSTIPCIVSKGTLGVSEGKIINSPSSELTVKVSNNDNTKMLSENQRHILGRKVYNIKDIDDLTEPGLLILKMKATEKNVADNFDTGVATQIVVMDTEQTSDTLW